MELMETLNQVEEFIASVEDSRMRRIITLRFNDNLSWFKVAERLGGKSTADSVRMEFNRFFDRLTAIAQTSRNTSKRSKNNSIATPPCPAAH